MNTKFLKSFIIAALTLMIGTSVAAATTQQTSSSTENNALSVYESIDRSSLSDWLDGLPTNASMNRRLKTLGMENPNYIVIFRANRDCVDGFKTIKKEDIPVCIRLMNQMYEKSLYEYYDDCIYSRGYKLNVEPNISNHIQFCSHIKNLAQGENSQLIRSLIQQAVEKNKEQRKQINNG